MAAYEGGQSLTGTTNQPIKHLAQYDERMYQTYATYLSFWKQHFGPSLFMHFDLAGDAGPAREHLPVRLLGLDSSASCEDTATCGRTCRR